MEPSDKRHNQGIGRKGAKNIFIAVLILDVLYLENNYENGPLLLFNTAKPHFELHLLLKNYISGERGHYT